jgi:hypothetical protein
MSDWAGGNVRLGWEGSQTGLEAKSLGGSCWRQSRLGVEESRIYNLYLLKFIINVSSDFVQGSLEPVLPQFK